MRWEGQDDHSHGVGRRGIVVVGGGIGGLTAAVALARHGVEVRVLERADGFREVGAGLQLAANATSVLDRLGLLDDVLATAVVPKRLVGRNALTGEELTSVDLDDARARYGSPYLVTHRADLLEVLVEHCRRLPNVSLEPSTEVVDVDPHSDPVTIRTAAGEEITAGAVVAADGLASTLRRHVVDDDVHCSGYVAYRGAVPIDTVTRRAALDQVVVWIGPGLHFVQYALRGGDLYNQVAVFRSEQYAAGVADWGTPEELDRAFSVTCEEVRVALPSLQRDRRWAMYDRDPAPGWTAGRMTLLGDAAHPMLQYLAQGACQAIQDAGVLGDLLGPSLADGPEAAFAEYERRRRAQASRVQTTARTWGDIWHLDGVGMLVRDELFRSRAVDDYARIDWLWGDGLDLRRPDDLVAANDRRTR